MGEMIALEPLPLSIVIEVIIRTSLGCMPDLQN